MASELIEAVRRKGERFTDARIRDVIANSVEFRRYLKMTGYRYPETEVHNLLAIESYSATPEYRRSVFERFRRLVRKGLNFDAEVETLAERRARTNQAKVTEQIDGSDLRLTAFWERAAALAKEMGYCGVYDTMASILGGPRRN